MNLLLDTNAYSALMLGTADLRRTVALAERLHLPMPVLGELLYGFAVGQRARENLERLQAFLGERVVSLAGIDFEVCEVYARIGRELREAGTPIPTNDHWIAAIALRHNFTVLTRDRHFQNVAGLSVARWER